MASARLVQRLQTFSSDPRRKTGTFRRLSENRRERGRKINGSSTGDGGTITYLIDNIDKGLGIASSETTDDIGRIPAQEDRFNERGSFALGNGAADQA